MVPLEVPPSQKQEPLSNDEILNILRSDSHVIEVKESVAYPPLGKITYKGFEKLSDREREDLDDVVENCRPYLYGSIIVDDFENNHSQRREWRYALIKQHEIPGTTALGNYFENNKLRGKVANSLRLRLMLLMETLDKRKINSPESEVVRSIRQRFPHISRYNEMSLDEKIKTASQIESLVQEFIAVIIKHD